MAVKVNESQDEKLNLQIDNGDLKKLKEAKEKWKFKDYQSFLRFMSSIMIDSKDNKIWILGEDDREIIRVKPAKELIEEENKDDLQK